MTSRAPLVACVAVLAFFAGITGVRPAYTIAYVLVTLLILALAWSTVVARRLRVERESPDGSFMVGEPFQETFVVENGSSLPVAYCEVHDGTGLSEYVPGRAFSLGPNGRVQWTARGTFSRRGLYGLGPLTARLGDPFGLFPRVVRVDPRSQVLVHPRIHSLAELSPITGGSGSGEGRRGRPLDIPPDTSTVRDYDSHDGMGRIHWLSTARTGHLMSRVYDTRQSSDLLVVLDVARGLHAGAGEESTLEYGVSLAASIVHAGLRRGQAVGLVANDNARTAIGSGRGETQRLRILQFLATVQDDGTLPLAALLHQHGAAWHGRGGIVVITCDRDPAWVDALIDFGVRGTRHLAVVLEPTSFGAPGPILRIPPAWRLAVDIWLVRRGDALSSPAVRRSVAQPRA